MNRVQGHVMNASAFRDSTFPLLPLGNVVTERAEYVDSIEFPPLSVGIEGITKQLEGVAKAASTSGRKLVRAGDLAINSRSDRRGACGLASTNGSVSIVNSVFTPHPEKLVPQFAHYLLRSKAFQEEYFRFGTGIVDDLWSTRFSRMRQIRIPLPDLPTQRRIADYLDHETAQIDAMTEALDGLVARLKERHSSVITHYIMNGIDQEHGPSLSDPLEKSTPATSDLPPMVQLRYYAEINPPTPEFTFTEPGSIITFMPLETVWPNGHAEVDGEITWAGQARSYVPFRRGDVLLPKVSPTFSMGRATVANTPHPIGLASSEVYVLRPRKNADARFISYAVRSTDFLAEGTSSQQGVGGLRRVTSGWVGSYKFPQYSLDEQRRIADHLDAETVKIDAMIAKAGELRALLDERRSALITATVTGQHPVPEEH